MIDFTLKKLNQTTLNYIFLAFCSAKSSTTFSKLKYKRSPRALSDIIRYFFLKLLMRETPTRAGPDCDQSVQAT